MSQFSGQSEILALLQDHMAESPRPTGRTKSAFRNLTLHGQQISLLLAQLQKLSGTPLWYRNTIYIKVNLGIKLKKDQAAVFESALGQLGILLSSDQYRKHEAEMVPEVIRLVMKIRGCIA